MKARVLFVDDVADWRTMLSGLLSDYGYVVTSVEDRTRAERILAREVFDLVIIDMRLDETDESNVEGLDLARYVKETYPQLPVVILTGYGTLETAEIAMQPDEETGRRLAAAFVGKDAMNTLPQVVDCVLARKTLREITVP